MTTIADIIERDGPLSAVAVAIRLVEEGVVADRPQAFRAIADAYSLKEIAHGPNDTLVLSALETARRDKRPFDVKTRLQEALEAYGLESQREHIIPSCVNNFEQRIRAIVECLPLDDDRDEPPPGYEVLDCHDKHEGYYYQARIEWVGERHSGCDAGRRDAIAEAWDHARKQVEGLKVVDEATDWLKASSSYQGGPP